MNDLGTGDEWTFNDCRLLMQLRWPTKRYVQRPSKSATESGTPTSQVVQYCFSKMSKELQLVVVIETTCTRIQLFSFQGLLPKKRLKGSLLHTTRVNGVISPAQ